MPKIHQSKTLVILTTLMVLAAASFQRFKTFVATELREFSVNQQAEGQQHRRRGRRAVLTLFAAVSCDFPHLQFVLRKFIT